MTHMLHIPAPNELHSILHSISRKDADMLINTIHFLDHTYPQKDLATHIVNSIYGALAVECDEYEKDRFEKLHHAARLIAQHIDIQNTHNRPAFHNRGHMLQVMMCGQIIDHAQPHSSPNIPKLSVSDRACGALADLLHDLDHDGRNNIINGSYDPMHMENKSLMAAHPFLEAACVDPDDIKRITAIVRASDPSLPKEIMRTAYHTHFSTHDISKDRTSLSQEILHYPVETQRQLSDLMDLLERDHKTAFMAARLGDADLLPSFGMDETINQRETYKLHQEFIQNGASMLCDEGGKPLPAARLFALLKMLDMQPDETNSYKARFYTPGAQWLGNDMASFFQQNAEMMLGREKTETIYLATGVPYQLCG